MGYLTSTFKLSASLTREINSIAVGNNTLLSLACVGLTTTAIANSAWCEIGILSDGVDEAQRVAFLGAGYIDPNNPIAWSGTLPVDDNARVYAVISGAINFEYRLTALLVPKIAALTPEGPRAP